MRFERVWRTGAGPPFPASCATSLIGTPVVSSNAVLSTGADSRQCESRTASATDGQARRPLAKSVQSRGGSPYGLRVPQRSVSLTVGIM